MLVWRNVGLARGGDVSFAARNFFSASATANAAPLYCLLEFYSSILDEGSI